MNTASPNSASTSRKDLVQQIPSQRSQPQAPPVEEAPLQNQATTQPTKTRRGRLVKPTPKYSSQILLH